MFALDVQSLQNQHGCAPSSLVERDGCEFGVILGGTVRSRREKQPTRENRALRCNSLLSVA